MESQEYGTYTKMKKEKQDLSWEDSNLEGKHIK